MNKTAEFLCSEIQGAKLAYVQSDEISILFDDLNNIELICGLMETYKKLQVFQQA